MSKLTEVFRGKLPGRDSGSYIARYEAHSGEVKFDFKHGSNGTLGLLLEDLEAIAAAARERAIEYAKEHTCPVCGEGFRDKVNGVAQVSGRRMVTYVHYYEGRVATGCVELGEYMFKVRVPGAGAKSRDYMEKEVSVGTLVRHVAYGWVGRIVELSEEADAGGVGVDFEVMRGGEVKVQRMQVSLDEVEYAGEGM